MNPTQDLDQKPQKRSIEAPRQGKDYPEERQAVMSILSSPRLKTPKEKVSGLEFFWQIQPKLRRRHR